MKVNPYQQLTSEIIWWLFTFVLAALVLLPIYDQRIDFPFYLYNAIFVVAAITLTRYLFLLRISWLRDRFVLQAGLIFLLIPLLFAIGQGLNEFITYLDNNGPDYLVRHLNGATARNMNTYLKSEYLFFGTWAIVSGLLLPFWIILTIWKRYQGKKARSKS